MKAGKYFYMGIGMIMALAIGATAFAFTDSTQAAADENGIVAQVVQEGIGPNLDDGFGDAAHPGPGRGDRDGRRGQRDNSALLEELGVTQEEWDAAKEAVKATFEDSEERPDRDAVKAVFADELGVTVEELDAAKEAVREAKLAEALANGDITQEQIDLMEARKAVAETIDRQAVMADILGVTVEEIEAAKEDGTFRDLVEASGLTREEIKAAAEEAYRAAIDQAVADGLITQEQADMLEEAGFGGKGKGGRGHGGKGGKGGRGNGNNNGFGGVSTGANDA